MREVTSAQVAGFCAAISAAWFAYWPASKGNAHAAEHLERRGRAQESVVDPGTVGYSVNGNPRRSDAGRVAQDAPGRVLAIEEIIDRSKDFEMRHRLIGRMQVDRRVAWNGSELIGLIPDVVEAADEVQRGAHRPRRNDFIFGSQLQAVIGYAGQVVARFDLNVAERVLVRVRRSRILSLENQRQPSQSNARPAT